MKVCVVGLGKLGAPLAAVLANSGHSVVGVDQSQVTVDTLNRGAAPVPEPGLQQLLDDKQLVQRGKLRATTDVRDGVTSSEATFVIVPTPSLADGSFTSEYVLSAVAGIGAALRDQSEWHLVTITSTVMPGSTDGHIKAALEQESDRIVGQSLGLCYSPEFIALGSVIKDMTNPDMFLVGEHDAASGDVLEQILQSMCANERPLRRMSLVNAEWAKISVNAYITMKIAFANQLAEICERIDGGDATQICEAVGLDERIGNKFLRPGPPAAGPCLPRDSRAFAEGSRRLGVSGTLALATENVNRRQIHRLVAYVLEDKVDAVGILGLSYKPGTPVIDESPGVALAELLVGHGIKVYVHDPLVNPRQLSNLGADWCPPAAMGERVQTVFIMTSHPEYKNVSYSDDVLVVDAWGIAEGKNVWRIGQGPTSSH